MLADCDALVLVLRSAVSRVAHHLALARRGRPIPLISLQWTASSAFAKQARTKGSALRTMQRARPPAISAADQLQSTSKARRMQKKRRYVKKRMLERAHQTRRAVGAGTAPTGRETIWSPREAE